MRPPYLYSEIFHASKTMTLHWDGDTYIGLNNGLLHIWHQPINIIIWLIVNLTQRNIFQWIIF